MPDDQALEGDFLFIEDKRRLLEEHLLHGKIGMGKVIGCAGKFARDFRGVIFQVRKIDVDDSGQLFQDLHFFIAIRIINDGDIQTLAKGELQGPEMGRIRWVGETRLIL